MEATTLPGRTLVPRSPQLLARFGDERLVEQARRGNDAAYGAIYDRYAPGLLSFCRHMLGSREEAEDAVQQTFASAHRSLQRDEREITLKPWLYTIARNRCFSMLRARREQPSEETDRLSTAGLSEEVERRVELRELLADLETLPERQRAALVLSEVGDLSHADVAQILECETKQVKSLVFQARSSLIESRRARDIPCAEIREQLATARGGALRRGPLRRHLQVCEGCAAFNDDLRRQRQLLAVVLPVIPTLGLKETALAAAGIGAAGGGGTAGGGGLFAALGAKGAVKVAAALVVTGGAVGGVAATDPQIFSGQGRGAGSRAAADGSRPAPGTFNWSSATDAARRDGARLRSEARPEPARGKAADSGSPGGGSGSGGGGLYASAAGTAGADGGSGGLTPRASGQGRHGRGNGAGQGRRSHGHGRGGGHGQGGGHGRGGGHVRGGGHGQGHRNGHGGSGRSPHRPRHSKTKLTDDGRAVRDRIRRRGEPSGGDDGGQPPNVPGENFDPLSGQPGGGG